MPDPRVLDTDFHDATIVDMGNAAEPAVSRDDLSASASVANVSNPEYDMDS